jgi:hypothetical protein
VGSVNRFIPDTWREAVLRYFAMAAPDANVYVEIPAPDVRFAAIVLLVLLVAFYWRRLVGNPRPALVLLTLVVISTVPWLLTSGNGRYWIPMLLAAGPLCIGLICLLPLTKPFKLFLAGGLVAAQAFVVTQAPPWDSWTFSKWEQPPYYHVEVGRAQGSGSPTTYVTLTSISYSLIAPQFPASSRWINITSVGGTIRDDSWAQDFLRAAPGAIKLVVPSVRGQVLADGSPTQEVRKALDLLLSSQRLALAGDSPCHLLPSRGLAGTGHRRPPPDLQQAGFWVCALRHEVDAAPRQESPPDARAEAAFASVERTCPKFFHGGARTNRINGGAVRHYPGSDMWVYVLDDGEVWYKFWRALNPVLVGQLQDVLDGKGVIDCDHIRGRSGLPWEREI